MHREAPWKGSTRGVTRPASGGTWTMGDVGSVEGGCHSKTAHADAHRVGLVEVGGVCEAVPGR